MKLSPRSLALVSLPLLAGACGTAATEDASTGATDEALDEAALATVPSEPFADVCHPATPDDAKCFAKRRTTASGDIVSLATPSGLTPANLVSAYKIPAPKKSAVATIGLVDAEDDPNVEADLAVYRKQFGLPPCTTANGCFKKVAYDGTANLPAPDAEWGIEISLDLDAVSAACPKCKILLVEAEEANPPAGTTVDPLATAVDTAVQLGAQFISNSYGITETTDPNEGIVKADAIATAIHYVHPGVAIFASSGDSGFAPWPNNTGNGQGANFPADIPKVFAVGGTRLVKTTASARGWTEGVWGSTTDANGASNSGCSHFFDKPSYQTVPDCSFGKEVADLSADADPASGMNIYDTFSDSTTQNPGWEVVGGTSLASPLTAAIFAASGLFGVDPSFVYANASDFNDVTTGENGTCEETKLCNGVVGYDGPTGIGTPDGADLEGKGVDGGAPTDGGTSTDASTDSGTSTDGGGAKDGGAPVDAGPVDAGPPDSGPEDAGPSVTWTTIYDEAFAPGTPGHCGNSGCHEKTQSGFACGTTASSCLAGMISKGLLDTANPTESTLGNSASSPLRWVNANGVMPLDNTSAEPQLRADIVAWVKAGAPGIE